MIVPPVTLTRPQPTGVGAHAQLRCGAVEGQRPTLHGPVAQRTPHAPQLPRSVAVSTQPPPQSVRPSGHTHAPPTHNWLDAQAIPHAPQFIASVFTSVQRAPHICIGGTQTGGTSAGGTSAGGTSAKGTSAGDTSVVGTSATGTSAEDTSARGTSAPPRYPHPGSCGNSQPHTTATHAAIAPRCTAVAIIATTLRQGRCERPRRRHRGFSAGVTRAERAAPKLVRSRRRTQESAPRPRRTELRETRLPARRRRQWRATRRGRHRGRCPAQGKRRRAPRRYARVPRRSARSRRSQLEASDRATYHTIVVAAVRTDWEPRPRCPLLSSPQHQTVWSERTAHAWRAPVARLTTPLSGAPLSRVIACG